eukprot:TRINITY_DN29393_c0_g1_i1.p2 TRINITY_DN29393_c0_g1~~TRINITY_DN29393_c0_g1_i1.p2  ORF type:complete len:110 (-),score=22.12 TRINITY_DN29393_c0_g1_i1:702-1031(-)
MASAALVRVPIFVHRVPDCASAAALLDDLPGLNGQVTPDEETNAIYIRKLAALVRPLHHQLLKIGQDRSDTTSYSFVLTSNPQQAELFYVPAFFSGCFSGRAVWRPCNV